MGLFDKIKKIGLFKGFSKLDDEFYENLEEAMIMADVGVDTTLKAVEQLRNRTKAEKIKDVEGAKECMREILAEMMTVGDSGLDLSGKPAILLFIGVNGVGKTTTIGKIGAKLKDQGKKVLSPLRIPSGRRRRAADDLGGPGRARRLSARTRERTRRQWCLTPSLRQRPGAVTRCWWTQPAGCTTRPI